jgi:hypothetical protein
LKGGEGGFGVDGVDGGNDLYIYLGFGYYCIK